MTARIGVCSWSLQPSGPADLARKARACGLDWVQLALDPLRTGAWKVDETQHALHGAGIGILSGMMAMAGEDYSTLETIRATGGVRPDSTWEKNLAAARENAALARDLGLTLVSFHAGFISEPADDPERAKMLDRIRTLVDVFAECGVRVGLETGQESEGCLHRALLDLRRSGAGINFDPANLILYGMGDPDRGARPPARVGAPDPREGRDAGAEAGRLGDRGSGWRGRRRLGRLVRGPREARRLLRFRDRARGRSYADGGRPPRAAHDRGTTGPRRLTPHGDVRVGVIGLGFMGRVHLTAYDEARRRGWPCRVVAICDRKPERLAAVDAARAGVRDDRPGRASGAPRRRSREHLHADGHARGPGDRRARGGQARARREARRDHRGRGRAARGRRRAA